MITYLRAMLHKSRTTAQRGLTLVELIVSMGLMSIFMLVLTDIVVAVGDVQTESEAASAVAQDGRYILARLSYDVQRAESIATPPFVGASSTQMVLTIGGGTAYTYALSGGNLRLTANSLTDNLNSSETTVSGFSIQRYGNSGGKHTLTISFTLTSTATRDTGAEVKTFTTTVGVR
jgi:prepilin-type N-terminal cleavage/methylation domain-containing protein